MNRICLKIDSHDLANADFLTKSLKKSIPNFDWEYSDYTLDEWNSLLGVYKVSASKDIEFKGDLNWPPISVFLKDSKKKDSVWLDIQEKLLPFLSTKIKKLEEIVITSFQLQKLLAKVSDSNLKFSFDLPDGRFVSVNKDLNEALKEGETVISTSDIASMLAASWLFNSKSVRLDG
jgi:hypothetical protein